MIDHFQWLDVFKTLAALVAGMMLGLERELKDKSAGLKTMSVICLGAALFSIISYKVGGPENTRIASYIVSGVGFIGAGVIFKDGFSVSGLTTAGIIWLAAAIGTAIGFGEFYLAGIFLVVSLLLIYGSPYVNQLLKRRKQVWQLEFQVGDDQQEKKEGLVQTLNKERINVEEKEIELKEGKIHYRFEIEIHGPKVQWLNQYLLNQAGLSYFRLKD